MSQQVPGVVPKRILMVLDKPFPPDIRVLNEAVMLVEAGFKVCVLSIGPDNRPDRETFRGIEIIRHQMSAQLRNKLRGLAGTVPLLTQFLRWLLMRVRTEFPYDALHMHDLYLVGGGLAAGRRVGVPVVADLHENWVQALSLYAWSTRLPGRLLVSRSRWETLEKRWLQEAAKVIVVVQEARQRVEELGIAPSKLIVTPNTIKIEDFEQYPLVPEIVESVESPFTIVYTGGIDLHRGLDTVVRAMPSVLGSIPARLVIVGDGSTRGELVSLAEDLGVSDHITFTGWQPQKHMRSYIAGSQVCVVPHAKGGQNDAALPHKLFHYMYMKRPVVVTACRPLKRIVQEAQCGLVCSPGDPRSMAEALIRLYRDPHERLQMGRSGHRAVTERHNWDHTARAMVRMYEWLLGSTGIRAGPVEGPYLRV